MKLEHGTPREIEGESMRIIGQELEAMGINDAIAIYQGAYDRQTA